MRITITANSAWNIAHFRKPLLRHFLARGDAVTVLAPSDAGVGPLQALGCTTRDLTMSASGLNPLGEVRLANRIKRDFAALRPDVVLSYTIKNNIYGAFAAQRLSIPLIPNVTGLGTAFLSGRLLRQATVQLYRLAFRRLPIVFFQNQDDRELFLEHRIIRRDQARILPGSGIDLVHFAAAPMPPADAAPCFLMIARLLRDKGVVEFVEASAMVKRRFPAARFQLLGALGAANRTAISAEVLETWTAAGAIEYLGEVTDVRPHIAAATCVVLPSYREGAPRTLIEAAAIARPIIATDVPGCRTVVDHERSGFLCKAADAESLAAALLQFLELSPEAQAALGQAGRRKMEREFDEAIVVGAYSDAISELTRAPALVGDKNGS